MRKFIAYYRVSTDKQGKSRLGLEAQKAAYEAFLVSTGGVTVASYTEVETGRSTSRAELEKAVAQARFSGAELVVAKLDRLARNSKFLMALYDSGLTIVFCDLPNIPPGPVGRFLIQQMANVAELEAGLIAQRTREALAAFRETKMVPRRLRDAHPGGVPEHLVAATAGKLGASLPQCRNLTAEARRRGSRASGEAARRAAAESDSFIRPVVIDLHAQGLSLGAIARRLNEMGYKTRGGAEWSTVQVRRVLGRASVAA